MGTWTGELIFDDGYNEKWVFDLKAHCYQTVNSSDETTLVDKFAAPITSFSCTETAREHVLTTL